jgi:DNA gyrase/topoisomerase IV subunit B
VTPPQVRLSSAECHDTGHFLAQRQAFNCFGYKLDTVYTNEELYYIMKTLNIEEDIDNLRYAKVVIATDADVDGLHIRNLLITFFLSYFEPLVLAGHLYILDTPLFRVRNKKETIYCYSEDERDAAAASLGKSAEITRFKGLGEISPGEFGQFIGEDIRLNKVTIDHSKGINEMLKFYMGDNTPDRWEHIVNNLV